MSLENRKYDNQDPTLKSKSEQGSKQKSESTFNKQRRTFLKCSLVGSGLAITAISSSAISASAANTSQGITSLHSPPKQPSSLEFPLLTLHFNNEITLFNSRSEMGQGVTTTLAQYLLDEMDAQWSQITAIKQSPANKEVYGNQNTIGAISSFIGWKVHRDAGARIRQLLVNEASRIWKVGTDTIKTQSGYVIHKPTQQKLSFGELASLIKEPQLPEEFQRKEANDFNLIGKSQPRLDLPDKINGSALFGIDVGNNVGLENLKTAIVIRPPVFGSHLKEANSEDLKKLQGIVDVVEIPQGLAIVAEGFWNAQQARKKAQISWTNTAFERTSSNSLMAKFKKQTRTPDKKLNEKGDVIASWQSSDHKIQIDFEFPLVAHATMEPMNCTAWQTKGSLKIWAPTQNRNNAKQRLMDEFKLSESQIEFNTTLMGGGFGRRAQEDFVLEAANLARMVDYPVKMIWSREDDIQHDFYRPLNAQSIRVTTDKNKKIESWQHNIATLSTSPWHFSLEERNTDSGDWVAYGGAEQSLYESEHFSCGISLTKTPMTTGILRGISHGYTNFSREVVVSEIAKALNEDPIQFRRKHINNDRALAVLDKFKEVTRPYRAEDKYRTGIAFGFEKAPQGPYQYYNAASFVFVNNNNQWHPEKLIVVLDHGTVVNPDGLLSQIQGATVFALGMMLQNHIKLEMGKIQQSNFHDYPLPRIGSQIPIELHTIESEEWPMGVGEKLQGTIQPAIANAIANITSVPITQLPIKQSFLNTHHIQLGVS